MLGALSPDEVGSPLRGQSIIHMRAQDLSDNVKGCLALIVAADLFSLMTVFIKLLGGNLHITQILLVRQVVMGAIVLPSIVSGFPGVLRTRRIKLHMVRIVLALGAMMLGFSAIIHLPLACPASAGGATVSRQEGQPLSATASSQPIVIKNTHIDR